MRRLAEAIKLDLNTGDEFLSGKFKNHKDVVKDISTDDFGAPTINGKPILKIRVPKWYTKGESMTKLKCVLEEYGKNKKAVNYWGVKVEYAVTEWGQANTSLPQMAKVDVTHMMQETFPEYQDKEGKAIASDLKKKGIAGIAVTQHNDLLVPRLIYSGVK